MAYRWIGAWGIALGLTAVVACGDDSNTTQTGSGGSSSSATASGGQGGDAGAAAGGSGGAGGLGSGGSASGGGGPGGLALNWRTLLGSNNWERAQSVWVDAAGDILLCGSTKSANFPTTPGAYDTTYNGTNNDNDTWVAKLSADGTQLLWSTFLGGGQRDDCYGVMTDATGAVYVTGWTTSGNFPTTQGAYDEMHNGSFDIFITKLNAQGTQLIYSTFVGGSDIDQCRGAMAVDPNGVVYFAGYTASTNYPTTPGAVQSNYQGGYGDALVGRLSADGSNLDYSSYLGTPGPDNAFAGVYLHNDGSLSVVGLAGADGFPVTAGVYQDTFGGDSGGNIWFGDGFATRMTIGVDTATVHYATYLGGSGNDQPMGQHAMTGDSTGTYLFMTTDTPDLPTSAGAYQPMPGGSENLYIAKLSYDGSALEAATYLGGDPGGYEPSGMKITQSGRIMLGGSMFGTPAGQHPVTPDAAQATAGGGDEAFFSVLSPDMTTLVYSTYVGGSLNDRVRDIAVIAGEGAIVIGDTDSDDIPITAGVYQPTHSGNRDAHAAAFRPTP